MLPLVRREPYRPCQLFFSNCAIRAVDLATSRFDEFHRSEILTVKLIVKQKIENQVDRQTMLGAGPSGPSADVSLPFVEKFLDKGSQLNGKHRSRHRRPQD
jgi:hypothetical protein